MNKISKRGLVAALGLTLALSCASSGMVLAEELAATRPAAPRSAAGSAVDERYAIAIPKDNWTRAVALSLLGGFAGGLGAAVQSALDRPRRDRLSFLASQTDRLVLLEEMVTRGIVGAIAGLGGLFVILLSPISASFSDGAFWAFLTAASGVFGVFAKRLLPAIERGFTERLGLIKDELDRVQADITVNSSLDRAERALDDAMSAQAVRSDVEKQVEIVEDYIAQSPRTRRPNFRLARVHFEKLRDREAALHTVNRFIGYLEKLPANSRDVDYQRDLADALYNRSCYWVNMPGPSYPNETVDLAHTPSDSDRANCRNDLKRSIALLPSNAEDAREDIYFRWMRNHDSEFRKLIGLVPTEDASLIGS